MQDANIFKFLELKLPAEIIDNKDSIKMHFLEIDTYIQANKYTLSNLFTNMLEVLQILKQLATSTYQWAA